MTEKKLEKCRIAVDAMGGDYAPKHEILGALAALKEDNSFELILVGDKEKILQTAKKENISLDEKLIHHASQIIDMHDKPTEAIKTKQDSSIVVGAKLVRDKYADAFVSAGNTGAVAAISTLIIGRLQNVERPTIGSFIPSTNNATFVFDVGAFVDVKPQHLLGYAVLAEIFVRELYNIANPTIGLLNVGEEAEKGNKQVKETAALLRESNLNFIGSVEGRDILRGKSNIVLCDGFVGNILLKFGESVPGFMKYLLKQHAEKSIIEKIKIGLFKNTLRKALSPLNPELYGGVPLLGVNGISIIGHGSSSPLAIKNMVLRAKEMYDKNLLQKFEEALKAYAVKK